MATHMTDFQLIQNYEFNKDDEAIGGEFRIFHSEDRNGISSEKMTFSNGDLEDFIIDIALWAFNLGKESANES